MRLTNNNTNNVVDLAPALTANLEGMSPAPANILAAIARDLEGIIPFEWCVDLDGGIRVNTYLLLEERVYVEADEDGGLVTPLRLDVYREGVTEDSLWGELLSEAATQAGDPCFIFPKSHYELFNIQYKCSHRAPVLEVSGGLRREDLTNLLSQISGVMYLNKVCK